MLSKLFIKVIADAENSVPRPLKRIVPTAQEAARSQSRENRQRHAGSGPTADLNLA